MTLSSFFSMPTRKNASEGEADEARIAKLRKDLVYMWRSRLYSDIIIEIHEDVPTIGNSTTTEEETAPAFYSHRFILATRAPYFYDQLITYGLKNLPRRRVMGFSLV